MTTTKICEFTLLSSTLNTVDWKLNLVQVAEHGLGREEGVPEHPARVALVGGVGLVGVNQGVGWE